MEGTGKRDKERKREVWWGERQGQRGEKEREQEEARWKEIDREKMNDTERKSAKSNPGMAFRNLC